MMRISDKTRKFWITQLLLSLSHILGTGRWRCSCGLYQACPQLPIRARHRKLPRPPDCVFGEVSEWDWCFVLTRTGPPSLGTGAKRLDGFDHMLSLSPFDWLDVSEAAVLLSAQPGHDGCAIVFWKLHGVVS
ncbi:hypothetical protein B0T22DRAFT_468276 [Podospora appendiculata]|uniref:Secreted protein n=1 Tax=Podospora appendiculata TaxID=314037 RepID=A0AAE1C8Y7_9PEZI|nr:hypothetical protein B0T22DRAFT_468276 [Podospora appendiculata]